MFINHLSIWSSILLTCTAQLLPPQNPPVSRGGIPIGVPITSIIPDLEGLRVGQVRLWISGIRFNTRCDDLPLEFEQRSENINEELIEVDIQVYEVVPMNRDCRGESVRFTVPLVVEQPTEPGHTYRFRVNMYEYVYTVH